MINREIRVITLQDDNVGARAVCPPCSAAALASGSGLSRFLQGLIYLFVGMFIILHG